MAFAKMATVGVVAWIGLLTVPAWGQLTFDGYDCTEDCSGHQAGYDWAEQNGISDTRATATVTANRSTRVVSRMWRSSLFPIMGTV